MDFKINHLNVLIESENKLIPTGNYIYKQESKCKIKFNSIDECLNGGFYEGSVIEFIGPSSSFKTKVNIAL